MRFSFLTPIVVLVAAAWAAASAQDAESRSIQSGVYTAEQAEKGRAIFEGTCQACHQRDEFVEGGYMDSWSGQKVSDFVGLVRSTMPQDSPGRLQQSEYLAVIAFFFEINGVPAGESELVPDSLPGLQIEGPFGAN